MPVASCDGKPLFDKDSTGVKALQFIAADASVGTLTTKNITLTGAVGLSTSIAMVAGILALAW